MSTNISRLKIGARCLPPETSKAESLLGSETQPADNGEREIRNVGEMATSLAEIAPQ